MSLSTANDIASEIMTRLRQKHNVGRGSNIPESAKPQPRTIVRSSPGTSPKYTTKVMPTATPRPASRPVQVKKSKELPICICGCGEQTRGGKYRPGHDSKHKAKLAGPKVMPDCKCGCGEKTRGGTFRPGHDAKFHSAMKMQEKEAAARLAKAKVSNKPKAETAKPSKATKAAKTKSPKAIAKVGMARAA